MTTTCIDNICITFVSDASWRYVHLAITFWWSLLSCYLFLITTHCLLVAFMQSHHCISTRTMYLLRNIGILTIFCSWYILILVLLLCIASSWYYLRRNYTWRRVRISSHRTHILRCSSFVFRVYLSLLYLAVLGCGLRSS